MKCFRTYWHKTLALVITGAFIYVQATALTCGAGRMFAAQHHASACHHENDTKHCCNDFTQTFFSAFAKSQTINAAFSCKQPCAEFVVMNAPLVRSTVFHSPGIIISGPNLPPPKIPDIRIFIRSFQV